MVRYKQARNLQWRIEINTLSCLEAIMFNAKFRFNISCLLVFFCVVLVPAISTCEEPIYIEADQMSSTEKKNEVLFSGNVDAKQGNLTIRSDTMTVYYQEKGENGQTGPIKAKQQIEKLICTGNVEITREDWLGTADKMIYLAGQRQVVLNGNANAWQGQNKVSGEKIIYYMDEGRSEVVGSTAVTVGGEDKKEEKKQRVKMTILQQ